MADSESFGQIRADMREDLARVLYCKITDINDELCFTAQGLDSILGLDFLAAINGRYGLTEDIDKIYDYPTVNELSSYIFDRVGAMTG